MLSAIFFAVLVLVFGAVLCFVGYRLFLVLLPIWGFLAGMWLGGFVVSLIFSTGFLATVVGVIAAFVVGVLGAIFAYLFYLVGVAIVAAIFGAALGAGTMTALGFEAPWLVGLVALACAIAVGVLIFGFKLQKHIMMIVTAVAGANLIVLSSLVILGRVTLEQLQATRHLFRPIFADLWFWWIAWLGLAVIGTVVQLRTSGDYTFSRSRYWEGWG
jgi:hypothetical protein